MSKLVNKLRESSSNSHEDSDSESRKSKHSLAGLLHLHNNGSSEHLSGKNVTRSSRSRSNSVRAPSIASEGGSGSGSNPNPSATSNSHTNSISSSTEISSSRRPRSSTYAHRNSGHFSSDRPRNSTSPIPSSMAKSQSLNHSINRISIPITSDTAMGEISMDNEVSIPRSASSPLIKSGKQSGDEHTTKSRSNTPHINLSETNSNGDSNSNNHVSASTTRKSEDAGSHKNHTHSNNNSNNSVDKKHDSNGIISTILNAIGTHHNNETEGTGENEAKAEGDHTEGEAGKGEQVSGTNTKENTNANNHASFSSKLDFLLKPAKFGKSKTSIDAVDSHSDHGNHSDNESRDVSEDVPSTTNVHFESIRESPLQTLGSGDLSLHLFDSQKNGSSNTPLSPISTAVNSNDVHHNASKHTSKRNSSVNPNDNTISFNHQDSVSSRGQSSPARNMSTDNLKIDHVLAHDENLKRNLSPDVLNKSLPPSSQLTVSGGSDSKKVRRKSISGVTTLQDKQNGSKVLEEEHNADASAVGDDIESSSDEEGNNGGASGSGNLEDIGVTDYSDLKFASKKRNKQFHNNFKAVPRNERLIDDFSCAVSKDILVQGRIYLSPHYVCFNSNILGWVTNLIIPLQEVIQIEKKSTAVVFPNAMVIRTLHHKYVFATFISRDSIFSLITNVWHRVLLEGNDVDHEKLKRRMNNSVSSRRTRVSDDDSYDPDYMESGEEDDDSDLDEDEDLEGTNDDENNKAADNENGITDSEDENTGNADESPADPKEQKESGGGTSNGGGSSDTYKGLPIVGPSSHPPTENGYTKGANDTFICEEVLNAPVGVIYSLLFGEDTSKYITVLKDQKNFDISEDSIVPISTNHKERKYNYIKPLGGSIGPKQTKCIITDTLIDFSIDSVVCVEQISQTPDVPSGGSFQIKTKIYLSWAANNNTKFYVVTNIEWSAKSWIKGAIEKGSIDGQKDSMKQLVASLNKFIKNAASSSASKSTSADKTKTKKKKRRSTVKQEDAPKPEPEPVAPKSIVDQLLGLFGTIGESLPVSIPYVDNKITGVLITVVGYLVMSIAVTNLLQLVGLKSHSSSSSFNFDGNSKNLISRVKINGYEYSVIPTVESTFADDNLVKNTQISVWEWIKDRSEGKIDINNSKSNAKSDQNFIDWSSDYSKVNEKYTKQQIEEMLALSRLKLKEIEDQILSS